MTATGDVARGILIFCCGFFLLTAFGQAISGQTAMAVFMLVGFAIPFSMVVYGFFKDRKAKKHLGKPAATAKAS